MRKFRKSERFDITETLVVSKRGQVTLPATLRKRLGISPGDVLIVEGGILIQTIADFLSDLVNVPDP